MENLTLFFCPPEKMDEALKTLPNPKVGCTSAGEIDKTYKNNAIVSRVFESKDFNAKIVKIDNTSMPVMKAKELIEAYNIVKKTHRNVVALVLNDGLSATEELVQSTLHAILPSTVTIFGASSGGSETFCCIDNDKFKGAAVIMLGTNYKIGIEKENISHPTNKTAVVTKATGRCIYELDGMPAKRRYAELTELPYNKVDQHLIANPFGRIQQGETYILAPFGFDGDNMLTYGQVLPGTVLWLLEASDYAAELDKTVNKILSKGTPVFTLTMNCINRSIIYNQLNAYPTVNSKISKVNPFGFVCYGEQIGKLHLNQTMTTLTFYK